MPRERLFSRVLPGVAYSSTTAARLVETMMPGEGLKILLSDYLCSSTGD